MDDLISRQAVIELIQGSMYDLEYSGENRELCNKVLALPPAQPAQQWIPCSERLHDVADAPTADAVEVVRCKDCAHYIKHDKRCGIWNHGGIAPYGFCFLGERRTDE